MERKCSQVNCDKTATWKYVWTGWQYACDECAKKALDIAAFMGFPTPQATMERLDTSESESVGER